MFKTVKIKTKTEPNVIRKKQCDWMTDVNDNPNTQTEHSNRKENECRNVQKRTAASTCLIPQHTLTFISLSDHDFK